MTGWQQDIFEGDYVRLITAEEYFHEMHMVVNDMNSKILKEYGGKAYQVEGCKYNGKIMLKGDDYHAYPPQFLRPWHKDTVEEGDNVSENDFASLIGAQE